MTFYKKNFKLLIDFSDFYKKSYLNNETDIYSAIIN